MKLIWCFVRSKSLQNVLAVEHHTIEKSIIEAHFTVTKTYLHVLNMKRAHAQLYLCRVGVLNQKISSPENNPSGNFGLRA